jgi:hypothetical protein
VRVLSLVLLLSHLACSSEGSPGNALSPPSAENRVPIAELPGALSELLCREYLECCSEAELVGTPVQGLDYDSCRQFFNQVYEDRLVGIPGSVERGRIKYDEVELGACLARRDDVRASSRGAKVGMRAICAPCCSGRAVHRRRGVFRRILRREWDL